MHRLVGGPTTLPYKCTNVQQRFTHVLAVTLRSAHKVPAQSKATVR